MTPQREEGLHGNLRMKEWSIGVEKRCSRLKMRNYLKRKPETGNRNPSRTWIKAPLGKGVLPMNRDVAVSFQTAMQFEHLPAVALV